MRTVAWRLVAAIVVVYVLGAAVSVRASETDAEAEAETDSDANAVESGPFDFARDKLADEIKSQALGENDPNKPVPDATTRRFDSWINWARNTPVVPDFVEYIPVGLQAGYEWTHPTVNTHANPSNSYGYSDNNRVVSDLLGVLPDGGNKALGRVKDGVSTLAGGMADHNDRNLQNWWASGNPQPDKDPARTDQYQSVAAAQAQANGDGYIPPINPNSIKPVTPTTPTGANTPHSPRVTAEQADAQFDPSDPRNAPDANADPIIANSAVAAGFDGSRAGKDALAQSAIKPGAKAAAAKAGAKAAAKALAAKRAGKLAAKKAANGAANAAVAAAAKVRTKTKAKPKPTKANGKPAKSKGSADKLTERKPDIVKRVKKLIGDDSKAKPKKTQSARRRTRTRRAGGVRRGSR